MAAFEFLLSQARRHCLLFTTKPPNYLSPLLLRSHFTRPLCSQPENASPPPPSPPQSPLQNPIPPSIQPISYPVKPKSEPEQPPQQASAPAPPTRPENQYQQGPDSDTAWTREDYRYVKEVPSVSPTSYPTRVAPLPEDRVNEQAEGTKQEGDGVRDEALERERRRIEAESNFNRNAMDRLLRREPEMVPFPTLVREEHSNKKKTKTIYDLKEAIQLAKSNGRRTFDETLEAHVRLTPELRRTDLKLERYLRYPHSFGKGLRVAVFAEGSAADDARDAGADVVGGVELIEKIKSGSVKLEFDKCIATTAMMPFLKQIAKHLKRSMPNAADGSLTNDVAKAVREVKQNVLFRKDKTAIVHVGVGKLSFSEEALRENIGAFVSALLLAKPPGLKKSSKYAGYVDSFHICSTMGPSFPVSIQSLSIAADRYNRSQSQ